MGFFLYERLAEKDQRQEAHTLHILQAATQKGVFILKSRQMAHGRFMNMTAQTV